MFLYNGARYFDIHLKSSGQYQAFYRRQIQGTFQTESYVRHGLTMYRNEDNFFQASQIRNHSCHCNKFAGFTL